MIAIAMLATWYVLPPEVLSLPAQHTHHAAVFGKGAYGFNKHVLEGIDKAQQNAMLGGGYFIGVEAVPTESPIGYPLALKGASLIDPPRTTSFCTGASYAAFIEALNLWLPQGRAYVDDTNRLPRTIPMTMSQDRIEALRMQEPDGSRREDNVKFWGYWNADGFGNHFALVQYSGMGKRIAPSEARPGDFLNISWKNGLGHSTVFLGWCLNKEGKRSVRFWSSQKGTNGMGDLVAPIDTIESVCIVRINHPMRIYWFNPKQSVDRKVSGDTIDWQS